VAASAEGRGAAPAAGEVEAPPPAPPDKPPPGGPPPKDAPAAAPDKDADALAKAREELEKERMEWEFLEAKLTKERIEARGRLLERQTALEQAEQDSAAARDGLRRVLAEVETARAASADGLTDKLKEKLQNAYNEKARTDQPLLQARLELIDAEESFRLMERRHELQRRVALAQSVALGQALQGRQIGGPPRPEPEAADLDQKLDKLLQEIGDLRRELHRPPGSGDRPKPPGLGLPRDP
jgi:hypothetical protein